MKNNYRSCICALISLLCISACNQSKAVVTPVQIQPSHENQELFELLPAEKAEAPEAENAEPTVFPSQGMVELLGVSSFFDSLHKQVLEADFEITIPEDVKIEGIEDPDYCFLDSVTFKVYENDEWVPLEVERYGGGGGGGPAENGIWVIGRSLAYRPVENIPVNQPMKIKLEVNFCEFFSGNDPLIFEYEFTPTNEMREG